MESLPLLFSDLYTKFLLRDFVGKIVPGLLLWGAIALSFVSYVKLRATLRRFPTALIVAIAGLVWILTLGLQSATEFLGTFNYFPQQASQSDEETFKKSTLRVVEFMRGATELERLQYERFTVIKEACGNLFSAILLSIPAWGFAIAHGHRRSLTERNVRLFVLGRSAYVAAVAIFTIFGLGRMHAQHVERQFMYADTLVKEHSRLVDIVPTKKVDEDNAQKQAAKK